MQTVIMQCFQAVKAKLDCKLGYFDLIGCDFMIDEDFKVRHKRVFIGTSRMEMCVCVGSLTGLTESDTRD